MIRLGSIRCIPAQTRLPDNIFQGTGRRLAPGAHLLWGSSKMFINTPSGSLWDSFSPMKGQQLGSDS